MSDYDALIEAGARALAEARGLTWHEAREPQADQGCEAEALAMDAEVVLDAFLAHRFEDGSRLLRWEEIEFYPSPDSDERFGFVREVPLVNEP